MFQERDECEHEGSVNIDVVYEFMNEKLELTSFSIKFTFVVFRLRMVANVLIGNALAVFRSTLNLEKFRIFFHFSCFWTIFGILS